MTLLTAAAKQKLRENMDAIHTDVADNPSYLPVVHSHLRLEDLPYLTVTDTGAYVHDHTGTIKAWMVSVIVGGSMAWISDDGALYRTRDGALEGLLYIHKHVMADFEHEKVLMSNISSLSHLYSVLPNSTPVGYHELMGTGKYHVFALSTYVDYSDRKPFIAACKSAYVAEKLILGMTFKSQDPVDVVALTLEHPEEAALLARMYKGL